MRNVYLVHNTSTAHYDKGFSYPGHNPICLFMSCLSTEVVLSSGFYDTRCTGLDWDDELTEPLSNSAHAWLRELGELKHIRIPRCLWKNGMVVDTMSLHTFVDASESA